MRVRFFPKSFTKRLHRPEQTRNALPLFKQPRKVSGERRLADLSDCSKNRKVFSAKVDVLYEYMRSGMCLMSDILHILSRDNAYAGSAELRPRCTRVYATPALFERDSFPFNGRPGRRDLSHLRCEESSDEMRRTRRINAPPRARVRSRAPRRPSLAARG